MTNLVALILIGFIAVCYWIYLKRTNKAEAKLWANQAMSIFLTGLFALFAFLLQADLLRDKEADGLQIAIEEELRMINEQLRPLVDPNSPMCGTGSIGVNLNSVILLPSKAIDMGSTSTLFNRYRTRDLALLGSFIEEHNRWANYALDAFRDPQTAASKLEILTNFTEIDAQIYAKAKYLNECLTTGTSTADPDCE